MPKPKATTPPETCSYCGTKTKELTEFSIGFHTKFLCPYCQHDEDYGRSSTVRAMAKMLHELEKRIKSKS